MQSLKKIKAWAQMKIPLSKGTIFVDYQTGRLFYCTNTFKNLQIFEILKFVSVTYQTHILKQKIA